MLALLHLHLDREKEDDSFLLPRSRLSSLVDFPTPPLPEPIATIFFTFGIERFSPIDMDIVEVVVPKDSPVVGKTLDTILHFRGHNFVPMAIKKSDSFLFHIVKDSILTPGDMLVLAVDKTLMLFN